MGSVLDLFADLTESASGNEGKRNSQGAQPLLVALADIQPDPNQPRKEFDPEQIANLAESIRRVGILQPLLLAETAGKPPYRIIEGERRWLAAHRAGIEEVPAYVRRDLSTEETALAQVIANANRTDLTDYELAQAVQTLLDTQRIRKKEVAVLINKSGSAVSRLLGMLTEDVRPLVEEGLIRHAEVSALFRGLQEEQKLALVEQVRTDGAEITTTMVRELQLRAQPPGKLRDRGADIGSAEAIRSDCTDGVDGYLDLGAESKAGPGVPRSSPNDFSGRLSPLVGSEAGSAGAHGAHSNSVEGSDATNGPVRSLAGPAEDRADEQAEGRRSAIANNGTLDGNQMTRGKQSIDLKLTVTDLKSLVPLLNASIGSQDMLADQPIAVRIPHHTAVALIEAMGATAPESPAACAGAILKLLARHNT